jgi:hypothetical protein
MYYNVWVVFVFVAFWHDLEAHLLVWALGICVVLLPEAMAKVVFNKRITLENQWKYKILASFGGALYASFIVTINLVGYGIGIECLNHIIGKICSISGTFKFKILGLI